MFGLNRAHKGNQIFSVYPHETRIDGGKYDLWVFWLVMLEIFTNEKTLWKWLLFWTVICIIRVCLFPRYLIMQWWPWFQSKLQLTIQSTTPLCLERLQVNMVSPPASVHLHVSVVRELLQAPWYTPHVRSFKKHSIKSEEYFRSNKSERSTSTAPYMTSRTDLQR